MIVPSIDLMGGNAVQLERGRDLRIQAGDPRPILARFARVGEVAVIDLDAAMGTGSNEAVIRDLLSAAPCRVGGGIRTVERATMWLDAGASRIIVGTRATPEFLRCLPRERVMAAVDAEHDAVVVEGWRTRSGGDLLETIRQLRPWVGGFLVTFVDREGTMSGLDEMRVRAVLEAADGVPVTIAGGVRSADEIGLLDRLGADAQVGMAIYSGAITLADAFAAPLRSDRADGLWPTVVCDERENALGLAWSSRESLHEAIETGRGVYYSRSRQGLWRKGETSGASQRLLRADLDCDRDAIRFIVRQEGPGFCHRGTHTCWGPATGLSALEQTLQERQRHAAPGSYTQRLLHDAALLQAKLGEEAGELAAAATAGEVAAEAADLMYFAMVKMVAAGVSMAEVERVLDQRARRITRRPGNAKTPGVAMRKRAHDPVP